MQEPSLDEIQAAVRQFLVQQAGETFATVQNDLNFFEKGMLDSLGVVSLVTFVEDRFSIQLSSEDLSEQSFGSLKAITDLVLKKRRPA